MIIYNNKYNIISIGDSEHEYDALINLHNDNNKNILKTIKLIQQPTYEILYDELIILKKQIDKIILSPCYLAWNFDKTN